MNLAANHRSFLDPSDRHAATRGRSTSSPSRSCSATRSSAGCSIAWARSRCAAARGTRSPWRPPGAARARPGGGDLPEGTRIPPGRSPSPSAASGAWPPERRRRGADRDHRQRSRPRRLEDQAGARARADRPALTYPRVENPSPFLAGEVTERIWPCVGLQWEWLGGLPPLRMAAVIGGGSMGTAIASVLARAGLEVQLGRPDDVQAGACSRTARTPIIFRASRPPRRSSPRPCARSSSPAWTSSCSRSPAALPAPSARSARRVGDERRPGGLEGPRPAAGHDVNCRRRRAAAPAPSPAWAGPVTAARRWRSAPRWWSPPTTLTCAASGARGSTRAARPWR